MINLIIAVLISLGYISSPADYSSATQAQIQEAHDIVIEDILID